METFHKFVQHLRFTHDLHIMMAKFGENRPLRSCRKVISYCLQKNSGVGDTFEPPISPHLADRAQNFVTVVDRPLICACVPTLVRIRCGLPDLFRKESNKAYKYKHSQTQTMSPLQRFRYMTVSMKSQKYRNSPHCIRSMVLLW